MLLIPPTKPVLLGDLRANGSFLRLLTGRLVTNMGDSIYYIAAMWLVFDLTGSAFYTGIAGFLMRGPAALSFLTGPLVDRWSLVRVLVGTQLINGLLVLIVPVADLRGVLSVWILLAVLPVVTLVNQFVYPAQNAALPRLVKDENLAKANSLLSGAKHGTNMVFDAVSGVLVFIVGAVSLFVIDSLTFGVALLLFVGIQIPVTAMDTDDERDESAANDEDITEEVSTRVREYSTELRAGIGYLKDSLLVALVAGPVLANLTAGAVLGVLPAFADTVGGPSSYGFLMAASAGGTFAGTLLASVMDKYPFGHFTILSTTLSGILFAIAVFFPWFPGMFAIFFFAYMPVGAFNVLFFTMVQSAVDNDFLGRVTSLLKSLGTVSFPVGSALGGVAASVFTPEITMLSWTVGNLLFGFYVLVRPGLRSLPPTRNIGAATLSLGDPGSDESDERASTASAD